MEQRQTQMTPSQNISIVIVAIFFLLFPFIFSPISTDAFVFPKQALLVAATSALLLFFGIHLLSQKAVRWRFTPFDLPLVLFSLVLVSSSLFAINRYDSLINSVPVLFAIVLYFLLVNHLKTKQAVLTASLFLVLGGALVSLSTLLSYLDIYIFPFGFSRVKTFTLFGSLIDQGLYLAFLLPLAFLYMRSLLKHERQKRVFALGFIVGFLFLLIGFSLTAYELVFLNPLQSGLPLLPIETGMQTAFATISQDSGRIFQSFLFGSGYGTYATDFSRFKLPSFNLSSTLWTYTFFRSSTFVLELLATTGILGLCSFLFLLARALKRVKFLTLGKKNPVAVSLVLVILAAILLPFSFTIVSTFFIVLSLFAIHQSFLTDHDQGFFDADINFSLQRNPGNFLGFNREILSTAAVDNPFINEKNYGVSSRSYTDQNSLSQIEMLPVMFFLVFLAIVLATSFELYNYVASDTIFQNSLVAASKNNAAITYTLQNSALQTFPYRDAYHRIFSQVNLQIANSLAAQQPTGATPSAKTQQTIYTLIQQSLNEGRAATTLSPQTAANWQNLSSLYRNLIGFGKNAEQFAIVADQQAVVLDPSNPQEYITLGGIYYQLGQWDNAIRQFQIAINLKPDYANAYYNLGHALEQKGDLQNAKQAYEAVKGLVVNDKTSLKKITDELSGLEKRIGEKQQQAVAGTQTQQESAPQPGDNQLKISSSSAKLPKQTTPVQIPPPPNATSSAR